MSGVRGSPNGIWCAAEAEVASSHSGRSSIVGEGVEEDRRDNRHF